MLILGIIYAGMLDDLLEGNDRRYNDNVIIEKNWQHPEWISLLKGLFWKLLHAQNEHDQYQSCFNSTIAIVDSIIEKLPYNHSLAQKMKEMKNYLLRFHANNIFPTSYYILKHLDKEYERRFLDGLSIDPESLTSFKYRERSKSSEYDLYNQLLILMVQFLQKRQCSTREECHNKDLNIVINLIKKYKESSYMDENVYRKIKTTVENIFSNVEEEKFWPAISYIESSLESNSWQSLYSEWQNKPEGSYNALLKHYQVWHEAQRESKKLQQNSKWSILDDKSTIAFGSIPNKDKQKRRKEHDNYYSDDEKKPRKKHGVLGEFENFFGSAEKTFGRLLNNRNH